MLDRKKNCQDVHYGAALTPYMVFLKPSVACPVAVRSCGPAAVAMILVPNMIPLHLHHPSCHFGNALSPHMLMFCLCYKLVIVLRLMAVRHCRRAPSRATVSSFTAPPFLLLSQCSAAALPIGTLCRVFGTGTSAPDRSRPPSRLVAGRARWRPPF